MLYTGKLRRCELQGYWYQVHDCAYRAKGYGVLLAWVTTTLPLYLLGKVTVYTHSAYSNQTAVTLDESRGREASKGWVW